MQTIVKISTLVTQTQGICGGRPRIAGTRTAVQSIVVDFKAGMSPEAIILQRPHLKWNRFMRLLLTIMRIRS
jgi:uncharacterized protein (DUF433 family)